MSDEESSNKIEELQAIENHLHTFLAQKQSFQVELNSITNALEELDKSDDEVYRMISGVMIKSNKKQVSNFLEEKKKLLEMKVNSIEKQEKLLEKDSEKLKKEINDIVSKPKK